MIIVEVVEAVYHTLQSRCEVAESAPLFVPLSRTISSRWRSENLLIDERCIGASVVKVAGSCSHKLGGWKEEEILSWMCDV